MDFIEFLQNEARYNRKVIFNGKKFKVDNITMFSVSSGGAICPHGLEKSTNSDLSYEIEKLHNRGKSNTWYILKNGYITGYCFDLNNNVVNLKIADVSQDDIAEVSQNQIIKRHRTAVFVFIISLFMAMIFGFLLYAQCKAFNSGSCNEVSSMLSSCNWVNVNGTYYLKRDYANEVDKNTYFDLHNGTWKDEGGNRGEYKIDGDEITLYVGDGGLAFASGTISDGKLKLKIGFSTLTYIKQ